MVCFLLFSGASRVSRWTLQQGKSKLETLLSIFRMFYRSKFLQEIQNAIENFLFGPPIDAHINRMPAVVGFMEGPFTFHDQSEEKH